MAVKKVKKTKHQEDLEREWESILLKDKKKALEITKIPEHSPTCKVCHGQCWKENTKDKMVSTYSAFKDYSDYEEGYEHGYQFGKMEITVSDKITWALTAVNVAILISLIKK